MNGDNVYIATGDGQTRAYLLPVTGWTFLTVRADADELFCGPDYEIIPAAGEYGLDILVLRSALGAGKKLSIDFTGGSYIHLLEELDVTVEVEDPFIELEAV